jgi:hypothetical protein
LSRAQHYVKQYRTTLENSEGREYKNTSKIVEKSVEERNRALYRTLETRGQRRRRKDRGGE